jgi:hypothetical protein
MGEQPPKHFRGIADIFSEDDIVNGMGKLVDREARGNLQALYIKCPYCHEVSGPYFEDHAPLYMLWHEYEKHSLETTIKRNSQDPDRFLGQLDQLRAARVKRLLEADG